ncbi:hypothetical protein O0L34_g10860 [Tuta absoluta]|nr:hypothetical protein O0L34_g10860 [Tuta absoluta]
MDQPKSRCCKKREENSPDTTGIWMKICKKNFRHPCDPRGLCSVCPDEACPKPAICSEKIKNPQPGHETRCVPGDPPYLPTSACIIESPHPCDPPLPCKPGKGAPRPCQPALCKERVKNLEPPLIRCPDPDDIYSHEICENLAILKKPIPECSREPCAPPALRDPFAEPKPKPYKQEKCVDPNEWTYSRVLCDNLDLLKQSIQKCFTGNPCDPPRLIDPFAEPKPNYPEKEGNPCDKDPMEDIRNEKKAVYTRPCSQASNESLNGEKNPKI